MTMIINATHEKIRGLRDELYNENNEEILAQIQVKIEDCKIFLDKCLSV